MKTTQKMISLCSFFLSPKFASRRARFATVIAVLTSIIGAGAALVAGPGTASADETFTQSATITVPGGLGSFDISFVDPQLGLYFLADRTNATIDQVDPSQNKVTAQLAKGAFVGVQPGSNTSGPNGVITANEHSEVWAADGVCAPAPGKACPPESATSHVRVIDLNSGNVTHNIDTGGQKRADELCEDPQHHVVLVANDDDLDLFLTFISTESYEVVGKITLKGTDPNGMNIKATDGIEQCQWSPRTRKFYLAIPEVSGSGNNSVPGAVLEINPASMKVEKVFTIDFGFLPASGATKATGDCLGPQGLAIGPQREILLGCSNSGAGSVIISELDGSLIQNLAGLNGNDEVWYNPGDNHYFLAGGNHNVSTPKPGAILGVADLSGDPDVVDANPPTTKSGSHSVAADPVSNQVYVPVNAGGNALCGLASTTGCIAVFTAANDDPGLCNGPGTPAHGQGKKGDPVFLRAVCPNNNGHPNNPDNNPMENGRKIK